jgi:aldose 1-epimerase
MKFPLDLQVLSRPWEAHLHAGFDTATVAVGAGSALAQLSGSVGGNRFDVMPKIDFVDLETRATVDVNELFTKLASPLFPLANRLRDPAAERAQTPLNFLGAAALNGYPVHFRLNHRAPGPDSPAHHLHGSLFARAPDSTRISESENSSNVECVFEPRAGNDWSEGVHIVVRHSLTEGKYRFEIEAENRSESVIPVGFGAHPYFRLPSGDSKSARLFIPADRIGEIDNFTNVFPTGLLKNVAGSRFDFSQPKCPEGNFDHFFHFPKTIRPTIELSDMKNRVGYRMSALTENIIGAQFYYPGNGDVYALELVTHFPDPRTAIWGDGPTGIRSLEPGGRDRYGFEIELFAFD